MAKKISAPGAGPVPANPPTGTSLEEEMLLPTDEFWEAHKTKIIGGTVVFLVIAFSFIAWTGWQQKRKNDAMAAFAMAASPEAWRAVMQDFSSTPAAGNSGLLLAASLREEGDLAASDAVYEELLADRRPFALQAAAGLGLAQNAILRAKDQDFAEAMASLQAVATRFPSEYAASYALYMEGDLLLRNERQQDAIRVFQNLLTDYPDSLPGRMASMQLQQLAPLIQETPAPGRD
jgi:predicted negative regulator of RcsB-dependent stress response